MTEVAASATASPVEGGGTRPRILVVDDDTRFRQGMHELLEDQGFEVVGEAGDGSAAIVLAQELHPDVVLMDLRMPRLDGIQATAHIKQVLPLVQVLILSAYDDPGLNREADEAGVYCYLVKGCPPWLVRDMLTRALTYKAELEAVGRSQSSSPSA